MFLRIEEIKEKKLVGKKLKMSLTDNKTGELWKSFMPERNLIKNRIDENYISMQVYDYSKNENIFELNTEFIKWAVTEVTDFNNIPESMESYTLNGGLYAVFLHKGTPASFPKTFKYIFGEWLPSSEYELDEREHFELLGEKYKNNDPSSEEEIWIPLKPQHITSF